MLLPIINRSCADVSEVGGKVVTCVNIRNTCRLLRQRELLGSSGVHLDMPVVRDVVAATATVRHYHDSSDICAHRKWSMVARTAERAAAREGGARPKGQLQNEAKIFSRWRCKCRLGPGGDPNSNNLQPVVRSASSSLRFEVINSNARTSVIPHSATSSASGDESSTTISWNSGV